MCYYCSSSTSRYYGDNNMMWWWWWRSWRDNNNIIMMMAYRVLERLSDMVGRSTKSVHLKKGRAHKATHRRRHGRIVVAGFCPYCREQCEPQWILGHDYLISRLVRNQLPRILLFMWVLQLLQLSSYGAGRCPWLLLATWSTWGALCSCNVHDITCGDGELCIPRYFEARNPNVRRGTYALERTVVAIHNYREWTRKQT